MVRLLKSTSVPSLASVHASVEHTVLDTPIESIYQAILYQDHSNVSLSRLKATSVSDRSLHGKGNGF